MACVLDALEALDFLSNASSTGLTEETAVVVTGSFVKSLVCNFENPGKFSESVLLPFSILTTSSLNASGSFTACFS